jgi:hypothetical protein
MAGEVNVVQIMTFMYLTVAHQGDGEISQGEKAILDKTAGAWGLISA